MLGTARGLQVPEPADRHRRMRTIRDRDRRAAVLRGGPDGSLAEVVGGSVLSSCGIDDRSQRCGFPRLEQLEEGVR